MRNQVQAAKRRDILRQARQLCQERKISYTEYVLFDEIIRLSNGRLKACLASCRYLAEKIGRSTNHVRKLIRNLEAHNLIKRHYRFRGNTKHHLSNVIEVIGYTQIITFHWNRSLENNAGQALLPAPTLDELIRMLEEALNSVQQYSMGIAQSFIKAWWNLAKKNEVVQKFLNYFQQQLEQSNRKILNLSAYINKCLNNFSNYNCYLFTACLEYLKRYRQTQTQIQPRPAEAVPPPAPKPQETTITDLKYRINYLEQAKIHVSSFAPPNLAQQMVAKYNKMLTALRQQLPKQKL